jgi:ATP-binding cassette subfamily B protein
MRATDFERIGWGAEPPLKIYMRLFAGHRRQLAMTALVYIVKHSPAVLLPVITGLTIDVLSGGSISRMWLYGLAGALLIAQNLPGHYFFVRWLSIAIRDVERDLRNAISQRIQEMSIGSYQKRDPAMLQSKMLRDVEAIEQMTRVLADGLLGCGAAITVAVGVTAVRAPQFLVLFALTVPVAAVLIIRTHIQLAERNRSFRESVERMYSRVVEMTRMVPLTRAHALERSALDRVGGSFSTVNREGLALDSVNGWFNGISWVAFQGLNLFCLLAAGWAYHTRFVPITLGDVVLLTGFFASLTAAVVGMTSLVPIISRGLEAVSSIGELMQEPELERYAGKAVPNDVQGAVELRALRFRYPGFAHEVIAGIELVVQPGETIALVGPSGSGKSTLLNLIIGLLRPSEGTILLDGADARTLDLRRWRERIAVVPQESLIFEGSVRENVTYGLPPVSEDAFRQALRDACCDEFVDALPEGAQTVVGGAGSALSGGQRQRLAIARAFVRNPRLLFLDEASSALDTASEARIQEALNRLRHGRTTFIVAHRMQTVRGADRIVVMDAGRIVDVGPHEELLARCDLYRRLCSGAVEGLESEAASNMAPPARVRLSTIP